MGKVIVTGGSWWVWVAIPGWVWDVFISRLFRSGVVTGSRDGMDGELSFHLMAGNNNNDNNNMGVE